MKHLNPRKHSTNRHGVLSVELSLTLPLLFMILMASVEFGRMNTLRHTLDNAAYEAARAGIVPGATADRVEAKARSIMAIVSARGVDVTIEPAVITEETEELRVTIELSPAENGYLAPRFFRGRTLVSSCLMRREQL